MFIPLLLASTLVAAQTEYVQNHPVKPEIEDMVSPFSIEMSVDEINDMNLILNDDDCSDTFFQEVVDQLREDGLEVTVTEGSKDINQNNATIITLDQQYSAGEGTVIFAPYNNSMVGHSDSLALSMQAAFDQNGFIVGDISCGQVGYEVDEEGNVHIFGPTETEKQMNEGYDSSFVTISFGTDNQNAEWVAKSLENGLARQNAYLRSDDNQTDLIYRASPNDSIEDVADYFGTEKDKLQAFNHMTGDTFRESQTIVNPYVSDMKAFDKNGVFIIDDIKTKAY